MRKGASPLLLTPDLCVIGAGSGGLSVAAAAAAFGVPVVLVEKAKMGGDCLNTGCVPSKALIAAASRANAWRGDAAFGIASSPPPVDFAHVHDHVHQVIASIAPNDSVARFTGLGVKVIEAAGTFIDRNTLAAGEYLIRARRFVIATGSRALAPPIPGLADTPFLTNENIFDLTECPQHLAIIGGGPIGMEMAQAFSRLGAQVSVIEAAEALAKDDPECAAIVIDTLRDEGVELRTQTKVVEVSGRAGDLRIQVETNGMRADIGATHLLVAAGRQPTIDGLGLDAAGIKHGKSGIEVDKGLRTSNRKVYAIGDVIGGLQFTHVANDHAGLVIRSALFRLPVNKDKRVIPWVTYTQPELAHVGLGEDAARKAGHNIRVLRWPLHDNDRAIAERQTKGHIKIITSARGKILGATIVGANAGEMIMLWSLAISQGLNVRALAGTIVPYPTRSEIGKRAAITFFAPSLTAPLIRRIIAALRLFG